MQSAIVLEGIAFAVMKNVFVEAETACQVETACLEIATYFAFVAEIERKLFFVMVTCFFSVLAKLRNFLSVVGIASNLFF